MSLLAALLALQTLPSCSLPRADAATEVGWAAYRRGALGEAVGHFATADAGCPGHPGAQVGLGFVHLRQGRVREAERALWAALAVRPGLADAWYGLGLARDRLGRREAAVIAWRRTLRLAPRYRDAADQLLALGLDSGLTPPHSPRPVEPRVPARTTGEGFEIMTGGEWRPLYIRGVNLGAARPGRFPTEFPVDDSTYDHWLRLIGEVNANVVRLYTILPPAFYRAVGRWNARHPRRPLWLVHGVWAEPPPHDDYDDPAWKGELRTEMRRVVDVLHGRAAIAPRPGHAWGFYDADVSGHVLAYIIGREWEPSTITTYNRRRPGTTRYAGRFLAVDRGTPADVWMAEQCDHLVTYEWDAYHAARPVAYTNWPTLDPLPHETEPTGAEERALRKRLKLTTQTRLKEYDNDGEALDAMLVRVTPANPAGYFAAFHAYPYYPDFIGLDSSYAAARGSARPSRYLGYLTALRRHHAGRPVVIAEYGVPSSRGVAHLEPDGRHHGGHDERAMADIDVRLTQDIREAGLAGGVLFAWLDEWFKHNWVVIDLEQPAERTRWWHNVMDAEQHYGLLGQYAGTTGRPEPGGPPGAWRGLREVGSDAGVRLRAGVDAAYLYLALETAWSLDSTAYILGIDTYGPERGEVRLPDGAGSSEIGVEFVALLRDSNDAELRVVPWYNPYVGPRPGMAPTGLDGFYRSGATVNRHGNAGVFDSLFVATNRFRVSRDGRMFPARGVNRGRLRFGRAAESSLADWYVDPATGLIELRLPWGLLNVTDPSSRTVLRAVTKSGPFRTVTTDGFRFVVVARDRRTGVPRARMPATATLAWDAWTEPVWHERLKPAYYAMQRLWHSW